MIFDKDCSLIDFETQISLRTCPSEYKPLQKEAPQKGPLKKYKPRGLFSEFYGKFHWKFLEWSRHCAVEVVSKHVPPTNVTWVQAIASVAQYINVNFQPYISKVATAMATVN